MTLLAALCAGGCVFLLAAVATGQAEHLRLRLPKQRKGKISRSIWLRQAGVPVSPAGFWAVSAATGAVTLLACWALAGSVVVGLVPAVVAGLGPRAWFGHLRTARLGAVVAAWPDAIGELRSFVVLKGSMHGAIEELARNGPAPMRDAFSRYRQLAALSSPVDALETIRNELADPVSDKVLTLMALGITHGQQVTLALLSDQADQVAADLRTAQEIRLSQHEARLVNRVTLVAPYLILLLLCLGEAGYRAYYQTAGGWVAVLIAGAISLTGLAIVTRLVKEAAQPRVMGGA